jgi:hypothetical protein
MRHLAMWRMETQAGRSVVKYMILNNDRMGEVLTLGYNNDMNLHTGPMITSDSYTFNRDIILKTILDKNYDNTIITPYIPPVEHQLITYIPFHSVDNFIHNFLQVEIDPFLTESVFSPEPDLGLDLDHDSFTDFFHQAINTFFLSEASIIIWKRAITASGMVFLHQTCDFLTITAQLQELSSIQSLMDMFNHAISSRTP